ncbi:MULTISPECIES: WXG100 family type VII secretion target [Paenibacillus]|nr:WXG100 family type VII secretion target [Paenibacillus vini]MBQ4900209.1 WXG100 family type VII secretion target [Paenibacillus sp. Marseille-P2973]MDN4066550.1 WXG100 family type VII secretion target [Paenibacillus vini]
MYSTSEIRSTARRTSQGGADLKRMENQFASSVHDAASWWKGKASESFKEDYVAKAKKEIDRLQTEIRDLETGLDRLAREVQVAEDRRRAEAERQALLLKQQQKNKK